MNKKKVVVVGGGTGTSVILQGLKKYHDLDLTAVVVVSDNGGSTGRLRDEFGFLPVGDLRQCIAALSQGHNEDDIRNLLLYRFTHGEGLKGHNLGNLILTALSDMATSPAQAIEIASRIFAVRGHVFPITEQNVDLVIQYADGQVMVGESHLDDPEQGGKQITDITLRPSAQIYDKAAQAIRGADLVVLGPGDLYGSLLPNTCVSGFSQALAENQGIFVYVVNLMTHFSQTHQMTATQHTQQVIKYAGRTPDYVVVHNGEIPKEILELYKQGQEYPVVDDLDILIQSTSSIHVLRQDIISRVTVQPQSGDALQRSVLRHDMKKVAMVLYKLIT